jgi:hypothetical protein
LHSTIAKPRSLRPFLCAAVLLCVAGVSRPAHADIPPERQALILTRALSYDNNLRSRAGDSVVVAVLYRAGNGASEAMADGAVRAFKALENVKIQDLPFRAVKLAFTNKDGLKAAISAQGVDAVYACVGLEGDIGAIKEVSHKDHVLSIGSREEFVQGGLSLGVFLTEGKATITVNLQASRDEGAALSSELLRLAHVLR